MTPESQRPIEFHLERQGDRVVAEWRGLATYQSDRTPRLVAARGADAARFRKLARGSARAIDRAIEGRASFHAAAVGIDGEGLMMFGPSGVGKSTLAAEWVRRGATLHADDTAFVDFAADGALLLPGESEHWLRHGSGKGPVTAATSATRPVRLGVAVELAPDAMATEIRVEPLRGSEAMRAVSAALFHLEGDASALERHFELVESTVREVRIFRMVRPISASPADVAAQVERARRYVA